MTYWTKPTSAGWTCAQCGVLTSTDQSHTCRTVWNPVNPVWPPTHIHAWTVGHIATEGVGYPAMWTQVVYLICQCGASKRTVPE